jgi:hypothetical protein
MFKRLQTWFKSSFSYIWLIVLAVYFSVLAGQALYRSYQSEQDNKALQQQLTQTQIEKERWQALLVYYQSDAFREKALRQSLLLKMPDEKVYALPESGIGKKLEEAEVARQKAEDPLVNKPTWQQWLDFLSGERS